MLMQNFKTAEELKISPELYDGLHQVLRKFERGELVYATIQKPKPGGFNMAHVWPQAECGTAGCILGWAMYLSRRFDLDAELVNNRELTRLYGGIGCRTLLEEITIEQAAHALRSYLVTGTPDWGT